MTNADVDGVVYCSPTVCAAYPPKSSRPATPPARRSSRRSTGGDGGRRATTTDGSTSNVAIDEPTDEVCERCDVVERVLDERERDAVQERGEDERALGREAATRGAPLGPVSPASGW